MSGPTKSLGRLKFCLVIVAELTYQSIFAAVLEDLETVTIP
jgi:hypothetical protein